MHIPGDDQCVISDQNQLTRPDLFVENDVDHSFTVNYFRNTCVDPPYTGGGHVQAKLKGFKGGQGLLELVQARGRNPHVMLIVTGLKEDTLYQVIYAPTVELASCFRAEFQKEHLEGRTLLTVRTDRTGMAIQPWHEIDFHILDDSILGQTVLFVENNTTSVLDCGKLEIKGNLTDWEQAKNRSSNSLFSTFILSLIIFSALVFN
ncbi:unnamed protein product [Auanema sp. JU1783]|nr:unnamed protein product [Auanema sp. JU1783]